MKKVRKERNKGKERNEEGKKGRKRVENYHR